MSRRLGLLCAVLLGLGACSSNNGDSGDGGTCVNATCNQQCIDAGYSGGTCAGGVCQCTGRPDGGDAEVGADADADADADVEEVPEEDAGPEDAEEIEVDPCAPPSCGPVELCGESTHGDGIDNNCDTRVDEDCPCGGIGTTLECMPGDPAACPPGEPCRGGCTRGVETCLEFEAWSDCVGAVASVDERCDGVDNDCDDLFDEGIPGCDSPVICPDTVRAAPMSYVPLDGGSIYPGTFDSWLWEFFCPTTVVTCPAPEDPTARDTQVMIISSGTYRARATIHEGTNTYTCEYAIVAQGQGLRVELNWDTQGSAHGDTDIDLHLHRFGTTTEWCTDDDCYFSNCKGSSYEWGSLDWGLAPTADLAACRDAPHGEGDEWVAHGSCYNPRLDVDVISCTTGVTDSTLFDFCAPENINVDNPPLGEPFRILVNYWSDAGFPGTSHATINIYCGGALRGTLGPQALDYSGGCEGDNWLVADVQFYTGPCGALDCEIVPLGTVQRGTAFGPPWSTFTH